MGVGLIHFLCGKSYLNTLFLAWFHAIAAKHIFAKEVVHHFQHFDIKLQIRMRTQKLICGRRYLDAVDGLNVNNLRW